LKSILLIPEKSDAQGLLKPGVCGNCVPGAIHHSAKVENHDLCLDCDEHSYSHKMGYDHCSACGDDWPCIKPNTEEPEYWTLSGADAWNKPDALVLFWDWQVVVEGCDRVARLLPLDAELSPEYSLVYAQELAEHFASAFGGEVKVLYE
jgi:hypothetical protein